MVDKGEPIDDTSIVFFFFIAFIVSLLRDTDPSPYFILVIIIALRTRVDMIREWMARGKEGGKYRLEKKYGETMESIELSTAAGPTPPPDNLTFKYRRWKNTGAGMDDTR